MGKAWFSNGYFVILGTLISRVSLHLRHRKARLTFFLSWLVPHPVDKP